MYLSEPTSYRQIGGGMELIQNKVRKNRLLLKDNVPPFMLDDKKSI